MTIKPTGIVRGKQVVFKRAISITVKVSCRSTFYFLQVFTVTEIQLFGHKKFLSDGGGGSYK